MDDFGNEESDDQIENAVLTTFKAYDEIVEMLKSKRDLTVDGFIRDTVDGKKKKGKIWKFGNGKKDDNKQNKKEMVVPTEIKLIIEMYVKIDIALPSLEE